MKKAKRRASRAKVDARGFSIYAEFRDDYGAEVRVKQSSAAWCEGEPPGYLWIFIEGGGISNNKGSSHLTLEQAAQLRDALAAGIKDLTP